jgi:pyruvate-ferredoxin/flavodoxin oxidoreductase
MISGLKKGGVFLLNSIWDAEETKKRLPDDMKKYLAENEINFYIINATKIAVEIGLGNRTNTIMQSAFFKISDVIPYEEAVGHMRKAIIKSFGMKGEEIVNMNFASIERGGELEKVEVPKEWAKIEVKSAKDDRDIPDFIRNIVEPMNAQRGDELPVSAFLGREDGTFPQGTTAYENEVLQLKCPNGCRKTVFSVTSVLMFALTHASVLS